MFRTALFLFNLSKHVINCMFTNTMYITSQRNEIMYSILAMEEYLLRRALLATIYIEYHGTLISMNILQTLWLAITFGPKMFFGVS